MLAFLIHAQVAIAVYTSGIIAATTDLRTRRIPNWLSGSVLLLGAIYHAREGGWHGLENAVGGAICCAAIFFCFYLVGGMGAGDIKFIAAEGCMLGISHSIEFVMATAISGAVMAAVVQTRRCQLLSTLRNVQSLTAYHLERGLVPHPDLNLSNDQAARVPYALAIACGAAIVTLTNPLLQVSR